jgi:hypothetical protein
MATMSGIYEILRDQALKKTSEFKDDDFIIRGLWKIDLAFRPNPDERVFKYWFLVSQTVGQGSCYCDKELVVDESLIGRDAREIIGEKDCYSISILDSIYSSIPKRPSQVFEITGTSIQKTPKRNKILVDEVVRLAGLAKSGAGKPRVLNVGVLGNLIKGLTDLGYPVRATDLDSKIIGKPIHGVMVESGSENFKHIKESDIAVITGMTLTTDALEDIIDVCQKYDTRILMFAETGANFGEEYCQTIGVDTVVSEPFPFYIFQGTSRIEVHRREQS